MNRELLRELLLDAKAAGAEPAPLSLRDKARLAAIRAKYAPTVLSETAMELVILKVLSQGRADGGEIVEKLAELRVKLAVEGEGAIFMLLARLSALGYLVGSFNETITRKTYSLTDGGGALLTRQEEAVRTLSPALAGLWAT